MSRDIVPDIDRLVDVLDRIAAALEQANAVRVWPTMETMQPVGGATCATCGAWWLGSHYCVGGGTVLK